MVPRNIWIASFEHVQDGAQRDRTFDREFYLGADLCEGSQMLRKDDSDHVGSIR
jgi:hypothetical protein